MNMLDYLDWRGDLTFQERDLNEVDNLIFSTLAYLRMEGYISPDGRRSLTIGELRDACAAAGIDTSDTACDPMRLLQRAADTERFRPVQVCCYTSLSDSSQVVQFAAVTFRYGPDRSYIAFRGTDNTLVGWREDCNFSYLVQTPGQSAAAEYIRKVAAMTEDLFFVGGHSKGGNFAVYGSAFCGEPVRSSRILQVYSNDGPGFNSDIAGSAEYLSILGKLVKIIPESSIVGILLSSRARRKVITSTAKGIAQHNPYSWNVQAAGFEEADGRNLSSLLLDSALSSWITSLEPRDKQLIIDTLFDALESSGAETVKDLGSQKTAVALSVLKAGLQVDPDRRREIAGTFRNIFTAGKDTLVSETVKELETLLGRNGNISG
ncbi:MAG: DUF2974 domain-containing protein [Parasporobacterium sp.]|nr:DUF2974 domain-containing protein [Parasporobacterium sp.]